MAKVIIALVILVVEIKMISTCCTFPYADYSWVNTSIPDEEDAEEKAEHCKGKFDKEYRNCHFFLNPSIVTTISKTAKIAFKQDEYSDFVSKPTIPPPDMAIV